MRAPRPLAGPLFVFAGVMHFVIPRAYRRIVPPYLPAPKALVNVSGVSEIAGGVGLMSKAARRPAGWWLIATLIAVFPANVHMALHPEEFPRIPSLALWARLPFQGGVHRLGAARDADLVSPPGRTPATETPAHAKHVREPVRPLGSVAVGQPRRDSARNAAGGSC